MWGSKKNPSKKRGQGIINRGICQGDHSGRFDFCGRVPSDQLYISGLLWEGIVLENLLQTQNAPLLLGPFVPAARGNVLCLGWTVASPPVLELHRLFSDLDTLQWTLFNIFSSFFFSFCSLYRSFVRFLSCFFQGWEGVLKITSPFVSCFLKCRYRFLFNFPSLHLKSTGQRNQGENDGSLRRKMSWKAQETPTGLSFGSPIPFFGGVREWFWPKSCSWLPQCGQSTGNVIHRCSGWGLFTFYPAQLWVWS